ncbi:MAG: hypothetical protein AB7T06_43635 [Kofleriaceae bacterium]
MRAAEEPIAVGDRVRIVAGDLIGETGVVTEVATGHWALYTLVLDSDGTVVKTVAQRLQRE